MAFASFHQKELIKILGFCNSISPRRSEVETFTMTKFVLKKDGMIDILAINSSVYFAVSKEPIKLETDNEQAFLVNTDLITAAVGLINDDIVGMEINIEKQTVTVLGAKSKHILRIVLENVDEYNIPREDKKELKYKLELDREVFLEAIKVASTSVGNPRIVTQPEFLSICLNLNPVRPNQLTVISTDRFRMTQTNLIVKNLLLVSQSDEENIDENQESLESLEVGDSFLLDPKSLLLLSQSIDEKTSLELVFEKHFMWVFLDGAKIAFRYRDGKFPDWKKILPNSFACSFEVNVVDLLAALKQIYFSAKSNVVNKTVSIEVKPASSEILFTSKTDNGSSSESSLEIHNYEGVNDDWVQSFNADYLLDYANTLNGEKVRWEANPGKPSVLSPYDSGGDQLCLISGLR
jgi:DNA polymerase III sliding clamp (beta) subunit (PCNA family)